jgi:hypothetical protein
MTSNPQETSAGGLPDAQVPVERDARIYDYVKACNPVMSEVPVLAHPPELHQSGKEGPVITQRLP